MHLARSLTELLKMEKVYQFRWTVDAAATFDNLQKAVTSAPELLLHILLFLSLLMSCYENGLELVLMQGGPPIESYSKTISDWSLQ